ncbi:MAG: HTTM domain-containing protein [Planctomycetota bacterium]
MNQGLSACRQGWASFLSLLAQPINGASLALFRICFGVVMFAHAVKYLWPQGGTTLKDYLYHETSFNFTYPGFGWVQPFPEPLWTLFFGLMGLAALGVAAGAFYRLSAAALFATYTYIFLSEAAKYNNHYYLMCLFALLLVFMPADRRFSVAAWRRQRAGEPAGDGAVVPFWTVFLLRAQLFIVYFYGGIAKINPDWLTGIPMSGKGRAILAYWTPVLGLPEIDPHSVGLFICWFGLVFDLSIGFLLVCRRTRLLGFVLMLLFHLSNHFLFPIGLFPVMAFSTTLIFLEPDWPIRLYHWVRRPRFTWPDRRWACWGACALPPVGFLLGWKDRSSGLAGPERKRLSPWVVGCILAFLSVQAAAPFRHLTIGGDANWTEEGQDFSWRMMLRAKDASHVIYHVVDDKMLSMDEQGHMRFDWSLWPEERPRTIYVPIESSKFNWDHHRGLTSTYEPCHGLRIFCPVAKGEDIVAKQQRLKSQWLRLFGREVSVVETIDFSKAVAGLEGLFSNTAQAAEFKPALDRLRRLSGEAESASGFVREQALANLGREIDALTRHSDERGVREMVTRLHPFLLQGASFPNVRFLVVDDPQLTVDSTTLNTLADGRESLVWVDLSRLRPNDWKGLPQWFVTFENRELRTVWNYSGDLNAIQLRRFSTSPWMIRQFGCHIADVWQCQTGRRPKVRVVSNLMLNYRLPQPLIDPNVDIAATGYTLLRHNSWILPLGSKVGSAKERIAGSRETGTQSRYQR